VDALDQALRILEAAEAPSAGPEIPEPAGERQAEGSELAGSGPEANPAGGQQAASPPDPEVLRAVADGLLDSGDIAGAADRYLALAALHRAAGRPDAAMDACLALLTVAPSDHRLQLAIAALQADQGWSEAAADKLRLLARLAELDDDAEARAAVAAFTPDPVPGAGGGPASGA
jgi:hypothetical protein